MRAALGLAVASCIGTTVGIIANALTDDVFVAGFAAFWVGFLLTAVAVATSDKVHIEQ